MDLLSARLIKNAVVYPTIRVASHPGKLLMGVYDADDAYVEGTVLDRRAGEQGAPVPRELFPVIIDAEAPEAIYAGPLYVHYGHFLLESLARAWYTQRHPDVPLVWAGAHTWHGVQLLPWQAEILAILGITNPTMIIAEPTRFEHLHVPDIGFRYDDRFHPEHAAFLGRYDGPAQVPGHRLWLSRGKVQSNARDVNSAVTEQRLSYAGWTIARPEALTMRQQLDHLARASIVGGEEGSAFHSLILLKSVKDKSFRVFRRHGREHGTFHTIGQARQVEQTFHTLERERVLTAEGRAVSKINPNSSEILDILAVPVPSTSNAARARDQPGSIRTVADLQPQSLLVVGDPSPSLILGSTAQRRVAVCPRFAFDPRSYASSEVEFYELELARYRDHFHEPGVAFEVIVISGASVGDVLTSFGASKGLADESTVWVFGTGDTAARAALAVGLTHPGYLAKRLVRSPTVYLAHRALGAPLDEAEVMQMPSAEAARRLRRLPVTVRPRRPSPGAQPTIDP